MATMSFKHIMDRIGSAPPDSKIAVFQSNTEGTLDAVFANTVVTQKEIKAGKNERGQALIGVFDRNSDMNQTRALLLKAMAETADSKLTGSKLAEAAGDKPAMTRRDFVDQEARVRARMYYGMHPYEPRYPCKIVSEAVTYRCGCSFETHSPGAIWDHAQDCQQGKETLQ